MGIGALTKLCSLATAIKVSQLSQIGVQVQVFYLYGDILEDQRDHLGPTPK